METHAAMFGTDCGPACECGSSMWTYDVKVATYYCGDDEFDDRSDVDARCVGCGKRSQFETRSKLETIVAIRTQHEEHVKAASMWR